MLHPIKKREWRYEIWKPFTFTNVKYLLFIMLAMPALCRAQPVYDHRDPVTYVTNDTIVQVSVKNQYCQNVYSRHFDKELKVLVDLGGLAEGMYIVFLNNRAFARYYSLGQIKFTAIVPSPYGYL